MIAASLLIPLKSVSYPYIWLGVSNSKSGVGLYVICSFFGSKYYLLPYVLFVDAALLIVISGSSELDALNDNGLNDNVLPLYLLRSRGVDPSLSSLFFKVSDAGLFRYPNSLSSDIYFVLNLEDLISNTFWDCDWSLIWSNKS